jgi:hypothetical protein
MGTMHRPVVGFALASITALLLALLAAGPVLADLEQGHSGTVGFHELRDGSNGGAICRYKQVPSSYAYEAKLKWIDVRPPKVRSTSGSQAVGWRFLIERRSYDGATFSPWVVTYRSPVQRDVTNTTTNASFSTLGVRVAVPSTSYDEYPGYAYRVQIKMFWFRADGTVGGTATHLVERYKSIFGMDNGDPVFSTDPYPCTDRDAFDI